MYPILKHVYIWNLLKDHGGGSCSKKTNYIIAIALVSLCFTPQKTNMTMENQPLEDVSPIEKVNFLCHVRFFWG